ncbi:MAG: DUF6531 domain-containing protein, partial [Hydrogenophaga sp.]|nr:DUF6531 domain-containing protein [Hydrogenophaga sp.]
MALVAACGGSESDSSANGDTDQARAELVLSEEAQALPDWALDEELARQGLHAVGRREEGGRVLVEVEVPAGATPEAWASQFQKSRWFTSAVVSRAAPAAPAPSRGRSGRSPGGTAPAAGGAPVAGLPDQPSGATMSAQAPLAPGEYLATINFTTQPLMRCEMALPLADSPLAAINECNAYLSTLQPQQRLGNIRLTSNATANGILYNYGYNYQSRRTDGSWTEGDWNSYGGIYVRTRPAFGAPSYACPRGGTIETRRNGLETTYVCVGGYSAVGQTPPAIPLQQCAAQAGMRLPNPILPATGEKVFVREDFVDHAPHPLTLQLHYRTRWQLTPRSSAGAYWGHNHGANLRLDPTDPLGNTLILQHGDGSQVVFKRHSATSTWYSPTHTGSLQAFTATGSVPALRFLDRQTGTQWEFSRPEGSTVGRLLRQQLENRWAYTYEYNAQGRLVTIRNQFGRVLRLAYDAAGLLARIEPPDSRAVQYQWDAQARLRRVVHPGTSGHATAFNYEDARWPGYITAELDEAGQRRVSVQYDEQGRAVVSTRPGNADLYRVTYGAGTGTQNSTASITDPLGTVRRFGYAQTNGRTDVVSGSALPGCEGEAPVAQRTQTAQGLLATETDFQGNVTRYAWNDRLLLASVTRAANTPDQQVTTFTWHSSLPKPTTIQEPLRRTAYAYDSLARVSSVTVTPAGAAAGGLQTVTRFTYTAQNQVASITAPNGAVTRFTYDASGLLTTSTNALGQVTRWQYDAAGRPTRVELPGGLVRVLSYNPRGWLAQSSEQTASGTTPLVTRYSHTASGQIASITQPNGYVINYRYDAAQRLVGWSDNRGQGASFTLDPLGNRTQETVRNRSGDIALQVARQINQINRVSREVVGSDQSVDSTYDANGQLQRLV